MSDEMEYDPEDEDEDGGAPSGATPLRLGVGVHDISLADYLADPCEQPSLRSSDINTILRRRPAHMKAWHPRLSDEPQLAIKKATKRMDLGSVVHELVLGRGSGFCVIDPTSFPTKKGAASKSKNTEGYREAALQARARGLIILDPAQDSKAQRIAEMIIKKLTAVFGAWPLGAVTEQTIIWSEVVSIDRKDVEVWCRTRPDIFAPDLALVTDLKSCGTGLADDDLQRTMSGDDGSMFVQSAWQRRGAVALVPHLAGRLNPTTHVFVETDYPYEPRPIDASQIALQQAERRCLRGVAAFAQCQVSGEWPAWSPGIVSASGWLDSKWTTEEEEDMA